MKPLHGDTTTNDSCSCTSCPSKSESNGQTLRRLLQQGSRIHKLINGKYQMQLNDNKLLDELFKTRALYEALRSQFLSSTLSLSSKAELKTSQSTPKEKDLKKAVNNDDILELVNLVDKGAVLESRKLSECCSCCTCSSKTKLENAQKIRKNRQAHTGGHIISKSSLASKQENSDAKSIKSDSFTCACKNYEQMNFDSREKFNKIHLEQPITKADRFKSIINGKMKKSYHKLKRSKANPITYKENSGEGKKKKIRKSKQSRDDTKKLDRLDVAQKSIKDSFVAKPKAVQKYKPEKKTMAPITAIGSRDNKNPMKDSKVSRERNNSPETQNTEDRIKKIRNQNSKDSPSTSATSIRKDKNKTEPTSTISELLKNQSQKRNKSNVLNELPVDDMKKKLKGHRAIQETNQTKKPRNGVIPSATLQKRRSFKSATTLPSISSVSGKPGKQLSLSISQAKEIISNATRPLRKNLRSISTSSIEKSYSASNKNFHPGRTLMKKSSVKSFSSKETKTKAESPISFRRQLRLPSAPERFVKTAVRKDSPKTQQPDRNNKTSAHQERSSSREVLRQHERTLQRQKSRQREGSHQRKESRQHDESSNPDKSRKHNDPHHSKSPKRQEQVKSTSQLDKSRPRRKSEQREIICECEKLMRHKQSPQRTNKQIIKNIQAGGLALKRCLCTLKIKVKKTKSKINKNDIKEISQKNISQRAHSKGSISSVKKSLKASHSTIPKSESASKSKSQEMLSKKIPENIKKSQINLLTKRPASPAQTDSDSHKMKTPTLSISKFSDINKKTSKGKGRTAYDLSQSIKHTHSNRSVHEESRGGSPAKHSISGSSLKPKTTLKNSSITGKEKRQLKNHSVQTTTDTLSNKQRMKLLPNRTSLASIVSHASKGKKILSFEHKPKSKASHSTIPKSESASICECSDYASKSKSQEKLNKKIPENIKKSQHNLLTDRPASPPPTDIDSHKTKTPTLSISKFSDINKKTSKGKGRTAYDLSQSIKHTHSNRSVHEESREVSPAKHSIGSRLKPKSTLKNNSITGKEKRRHKKHSVQMTTDTLSNKQRIKLLPNRSSLASIVSHASKGKKILSFEHKPKSKASHSTIPKSESASICECSDYASKSKSQETLNKKIPENIKKSQNDLLTKRSASPPPTDSDSHKMKTPTLSIRKFSDINKKTSKGKGRTAYDLSQSIKHTHSNRSVHEESREVSPAKHSIGSRLKLKSTLKNNSITGKEKRRHKKHSVQMTTDTLSNKQRIKLLPNRSSLASIVSHASKGKKILSFEHKPKSKASHSTIAKSESASICECSDYASKSKSQEMLSKKTPENIKKTQHDLLTKRPTSPAQTDSDSHKMKTPTLSISKYSEINKKTSKGKGRTAYDLSQSSKHTHSNRSVHEESRGGSPSKHSISSSRLKPKSTLKNSSITDREKRQLKNHSVQTTTDTLSNKQRIKLLPNRTSLPSFVSHASKGMKILSFEHKPKNRHYTSRHRFSIELFGHDNSKTGHTNNQSNPKTVHKNKSRLKRIRNKGSQISNSTGKSRYTKRKHGLHVCLCRLKKENKKNNKENLSKKNIIQPENTAESPQSEMKGKTISMSTERQMYRNVIKHVILPYECETAFCGPQYNSTKSYTITHTTAKREERKIIKHVKDDYLISQSDYSLTSQSLQFTKNKVSSIMTHKSEILKPILKKNKAISSDITSQEMMSSFPGSLMYNNKRHSYLPADKDSKIKKDSYQPFSKDLELKVYKSSESFQGDDEKQDRSLFVGSTVKRYLYAFKLYKNGKTNGQSIAVNTDTIPNSIADKKYPVTQSKLSNQFTQYESKYSKPSVVMTKNNFNTKKRNKLKSFGIGTKKTKMVSKSSETRTLGSTSNHLFTKSNFRKREISLQKFRNMKKCSGLCNWSAHTSEKNPNIKINSNFSVNINIYEDTAHDNNIHQHDQESKNIVHRLSDNFKSLLKIKSPKTSRCFCALELIKKDEKRRGSKVLSPFSPTKKPNQVYTVSTVAMTETKIIAPKMPKMLTLKDVEDYRSVDADEHTDDSTQALKLNNQWEYCDKKSTAGFSTAKFAITAKNMQACIFENAYETRKENSLKLSSRETVTIKSKFNCELNYVKAECFKDEQIHRNLYTNSTFELNQFATENLKVEHTDLKKDVLIQTDHINRNHLTGVQPLLRRCYCTMNIQVAGQQCPPKCRYHHSSKLKDYECEPGVCVPYECDPYECQKRIMRRLMKKVSTMSGTDKRLKTSASLTSSMRSGSRTRGLQSSLAHEQKHSKPKSSPMGLKYQTLPRTLRTHRQAVRIGSNFSFDIEFSKRFKSPAKAKVPRLSTASRSSLTSDRHQRDRGTKGFGGEKQHRESQSTRRQMRHRGSSVKPMLQRCFCTLKLQKKGRQQKQIELQNQGTSTPPKFEVEKPILRTTETGQNTKAKQRYPELLPYECEPGICVPGECDPYKCLELIKRRKGKHTKDFGTDSIASRTSSSSMTPSQNRRRKQVQSRNIRVRPTKPRVTEVTSKPSIVSSGRHLTPSRQVVKIGSSFSFNIEFYKDKNSPGDNVRRPPESYAHKTPRHVRRVPKYVHTRRETREGYSQGIKPTRDFDSQMGTQTHGQSTMTSGFLKRCFCTAKLHGNNHDTQTNHHKSFAALKRCLCKLSSYKKDHSPPDNVGHESAPPVVEKNVAMTQTRRRSPSLLPYECEPGVCVPGFCDPYQCEKLIRRRRVKERMAGTESTRTRSVSSGFTPSKTSKAGMTQFRSLKPPEHIRRRDHSPREMVIEDKVRSPALSRRQAVKIGSSFNFNMEFYKDKSPNYHHLPTTTVPSRKRDHGVYYGHRTRDMSTRGRGVSVQNRDSQMFAARKRDMAIGPILRRCFCTLQLKRHKQKIKQSTVNKKQIQSDNDIQNRSKKGQQKQPKNKKQSIKDTQKQVKKDKQKQSKNDKKIQAKKEKSNKVRKGDPTNQGTGKSDVAKPATPQYRTVTTHNKLKRFHYKLEPYECEPGVCVPGECDPYECEKRIKNRGMKSSETLTEQYPTKSTSNMTRSHRRNRYSEAPFVRRKSMRTNGVNYGERPKYNRVIERPSKQVVKIGSSFNFDMEFFKDKSPAGGLVTSRPEKQYTAHEKRGRRRTTSRSTERRSLSSRNKRAQGSRTMHDMNSQAFGRKMRSTMTGAGPFLKRCFCTLQLQKSQNNSKHFDSASVSTVAEKEKPQLRQKPYSNSVEKSTNTRKKLGVVAEPAISQPRTVTSPNRPKRLHYKLEPYECEPGVCVPGECDPYECEKRIKKRMQSNQSGTEPYKTRSVSRSTGTRAKYKPRHTQARSYTPPQKAESTHRPDEYVRDEEQVIHNSSPNRQAVRISSSFSFSVEFYKDKSPQFPSVSEANIIYMRKKQGTETRSTRTRSRSSYNETGVLRNCQSQTDCIKSHCKGSCAPLRRCFCTLKLQKMGKEQQYAEPYTLLMGTQTQTKKQIEIIPVAREIGTKTKKYRHTLEPYECEPGVCVPGLCDPYECAKRIKRRNLKHFGTGTNGSTTRSISSLTSRAARNNALSTQLTPSTEKVHKIKRPYHTEVANDRPALCLGSNISFNIEFFKDKSVKSGQYDYGYDPQKRHKLYNNNPVTHQSKTSAYRTKSRTRGTYDKGNVDHRTSQAGVDTESRGSGVGPFLKRCFCTLTLQRAEVISKPNSPATLSIKKTTTKKKLIPPQAPTQDLEPNECGCLERIKKRGIRRISRTTGPRTRRNSQVSVSSKKTQYKKEIDSPKKIDRIIEKPRYPFLRSNRVKKGVGICSCFGINIKFYKEPLPPTITEEKENPKRTIFPTEDRCIECNKRSKITSTGRGTRNYLHNCQANCQVVQAADKSSAVGVLKRCFCTAKLHRQSLTVGRVEQLRPIPLFGPREYWVQYEISNINKKSFKGYPLETIMSPRKFHNCRFHSPVERKLKSEAIRMDSESKPSNFKKMLFFCRYLFRKRSNKKRVNNRKEIDQPGITINRQPWIDILKPSKSERNPKTTAIPTIKKSKSLKVARVGELNIHKKIFSRFQSGDADQEDNNRIQNTTAKNIKNYFPRYQGQVQRVNKNPLNKKVRFASLRNHETLKPLCPVAIDQPNDLKPISFLFKSRTFNNFEDTKLCSCCGGLRKMRFPPPASRGELLNNKSFKNDTGIRKPRLTKKMTPMSTKIVTFEEKMWSCKGKRKKLNQSCPCCMCKKRERNNFNNRPRNYIGKKGRDLCVCGCIVCKKEAEKGAESRHLASRRYKRKMCDGTKSNKEAHATDFGHVCTRNQRKKQRIPEIREKLYNAENKEINDKYKSKKNYQYINTPNALPFAESVLFIDKLGIMNAVFGPKRTYQNIQAFLRNPMRAWKKIQDAANSRPRVASLLRLQLRYQRMKCAEGDKDKLQECPVKNFVTHARETDTRKRFYPRKQHPAWPRQPDLAFRCSSFMLSLEKRPWLTGYYRCAWFYTHYLSILQVWRRFMDIILFLLAVAVWSPCMLCAQLTRTLMSCFLSKR